MTTAGLKWHGIAWSWRALAGAALAGVMLLGAANGLAPLSGRVAPADARGQSAVAVFKPAFDETAMQRQLGWHAAVAVTDIDPRVVTVLILDRKGAPLQADAVIGELHRAGMATAMRAVSFAPAGPNLWRAAVGELSHGNWDLRIEVVRPDGPNYRAEWHLQIRNAAEP